MRLVLLCLLLLVVLVTSQEEDSADAFAKAIERCRQEAPNCWRATADPKGLVRDMVTLYGMDPGTARGLIQRLAREFQECVRRY